MKIAIYTRVSTADQNTAMQADALRKYASDRGWSVVSEIQEVGSGGKHRPQRELLLQAARRRQIDAVLVWRLDRWGRSLPDIVSTLHELTGLGVGFVSLNEALDLTTPTGRAMAGMLATFSAFERDVLRERVKAGVVQARSNGKVLGRPRTAAVEEKRIRALYAEGKSKSEIARILAISRTSVRRMLEDL